MNLAQSTGRLACLDSRPWSRLRSALWFHWQDVAGLSTEPFSQTVVHAYTVFQPARCRNVHIRLQQRVHVAWRAYIIVCGHYDDASSAFYMPDVAGSSIEPHSRMVFCTCVRVFSPSGTARGVRFLTCLGMLPGMF